MLRSRLTGLGSAVGGSDIGRGGRGSVLAAGSFDVSAASVAPNSAYTKNIIS